MPMTGTASDSLEPFFDNLLWQAEARALRAILRDSPLAEMRKWKQPCYTFGSANVAILHKMRDYVGIGFFKGALLADPSKALVAPGVDSQASRQLRYCSLAEVKAGEPVLRALIDAAIAVEEAGLKVDFSAKRDLEYPAELTEALAADPELCAAFEALTPGRKRGYCLHVKAAKQAETRHRRIAAQRDKILAGLGLQGR